MLLGGSIYLAVFGSFLLTDYKSLVKPLSHQQINGIEWHEGDEVMSCHRRCSGTGQNSRNPYGNYGYGDRSVFVPAVAAQADPPPLISNNPVVANVVLVKQMTAYPNYGNPSRNADILYTGNTGNWTFEAPAFILVPGRQRAQITIRAVLDDHSNIPINQYSARITINGNVVHNGRVPLEHGTPVGGIFTNWRDLTFNINNPRRSNRITIENTSSAGPNNWIGIDWMEIRLSIR